ncbi:hypothetical protein ACSSS7_000599 [Eimeria intestinalis]
MGCKVSTPAAARQEPPAPFALPCLPNEFIEGDALFLTDDYVPYPLILKHKCIVAQIVNVADGDTFRGRHIPNGHKLYPYPLVKKHQRTELFAQCEPWKGKLKGETLRFRIYGVDAPETPKMGRPGQPFSEEATQFMKNKLLNRIVFVRLLAKDQGQNAQYNGKLARLEQLLQEAADKKVGIFAPEGPLLESPARFKRRVKEEQLELRSAIDPDYVTPNGESPLQTTRGRSPEKDDQRNRRSSAFSSQRANPRRASEPRNGGNGKADSEVAQRGRPKNPQRRKKKSRSRSARRRRAAERAAARAALPGEQKLADQTGNARFMSAQSRGLVQAAEPNQQTGTGSRKGVHVRGINGGDADPLNVDMLTYSVEEAPAATGSRRGSVYTDQAAVASMSLSSSRSLKNSKPPSNAPDIVVEVEAEPLVEVDQDESIASGDLSENEYDGDEVDEADEPESESERER